MTEMRSISAVKAKELFKKVEQEQMKEGDTWCLISHKWWMNFVESTENVGNGSIVELPSISNAMLTEKLATDSYVLKPKLVETLNFNLVPESVFVEFQRAFGVECEARDVIKRSVVGGTLMDKKLFVEIYLLEIKIANFAKKDQIIKLKVSQSETVDGIRKKAMDALNIAEHSRRNAQFYIEENDKYECLQTISQLKLQGLLLNSDTIIFIDESGKGISSSSSVPEEPKPSEYNGTRQYSRYGSTSRESQQPGLTGLHNLGNTCFMNSALQCLSNVPDLTDYFLQGKFHSEINQENPLGTNGKLVRAYAQLIQDMWSGTTSTVRPTNLKSVIGTFAPRFNGYAQQDSQELTSFLLDGLHEDLNRIIAKPYIEEKESDGRPDDVVADEAWRNYKKRNDSIIVDLLHGQLKSTLVCPVCSKVSVKFDPFCFLSVPVPAKEKISKSTIVHVRQSKWAKFAIAHSSKTSVAKALDEIKGQLKIPGRMVLVNAQGELMRDDAPIPTPQYSSYPTRTYYAYAVSPGDIVVVENKTMPSFERSVGVPLVMNLANTAKISRHMIFDSILPVVKELLWRPNVNSSEAGTEEGMNDDDKSGEDPILPGEIQIYQDGKALPLPVDPQQEIDLPTDGAGPIKVVLKWATTLQFQSISLESLVDREINLTTPMKKSYSLNECVDLFTSEEQLSEDDSWYCPTCKLHQRAFKKLDLWSLPQILIVQLKRFQYSRYSRDKIDTPVVIPVKGLDLTDKLHGGSMHKMTKYDLIGINNHCGGLGSGHYTARALNDGKWCDFNDSSAYVSSAELKEPFASSEAYILYYRRRVVDSSLEKPSRLSTSSVATALSVSHGSAVSNGNSPSSRSSSSSSRRRISESNKMETDD